MTVEDLVQALALPDSTRVNQRVPKKLLAEQAVATIADRRQIQDGVDDIFWLAALKPHLIGVPAFDGEQRKYVELAVLRLTLKPGAKAARLVELLHRAVPYPVLLFTTSDAGLGVSLAHLRASQNEADKTVLDGELLNVVFPVESANNAALQDFRAAMALALQPQSDLHALYQGWYETVDALDIAMETGAFQPSHTREQAAARHAALQTHRLLRARIDHLQAQARKERQIARQVQLNTEIRALSQQLSAIAQQMQRAPS